MSHIHGSDPRRPLGGASGPQSPTPPRLSFISRFLSLLTTAFTIVRSTFLNRGPKKELINYILHDSSSLSKEHQEALRAVLNTQSLQELSTIQQNRPAILYLSLLKPEEFLSAVNTILTHPEKIDSLVKTAIKSFFACLFSGK